MLNKILQIDYTPDRRMCECECECECVVCVWVYVCVSKWVYVSECLCNVQSRKTKGDNWKCCIVITFGEKKEKKSYPLEHLTRILSLRFDIRICKQKKVENIITKNEILIRMKWVWIPFLASYFSFNFNKIHILQI